MASKVKAKETHKIVREQLEQKNHNKIKFENDRYITKDPKFIFQIVSQKFTFPDKKIFFFLTDKTVHKLITYIF